MLVVADLSMAVPKGAPNTGYLDWLYTLKTSQSPIDCLEDLMRAAIAVAKG